MKKVQLLLLLFLFTGCLLAQEKDTKKLSENSTAYPIQLQNPDPLYIVDGIKIPREPLGGTPKQVSEMKTEEIYKIEVFKKDFAVALYGEDSKNGVVVITTKKKSKKLK